MSEVVCPGSAAEALEMLMAALRYLAAADATAMGAGEQARCLRVLEQATAVGAAARTSVLSAFTAGQGYSADADYSPRAWLIHKTGVTRAAAVAYTAWTRRAAGHPRVFAALATGELSESYGRTICQWTGKLPRAGHHRRGRRPAVRPGRARVVPAPPAARRPARRPQPPAGHRLRRDRPGRDPPRGDPAR